MLGLHCFENLFLKDKNVLQLPWKWNQQISKGYGMGFVIHKILTRLESSKYAENC